MRGKNIGKTKAWKSQVTKKNATEADIEDRQLAQATQDTTTETSFSASLSPIFADHFSTLPFPAPIDSRMRGLLYRCQ
jgi:hypothetical protein